MCINTNMVEQQIISHIEMEEVNLNVDSIVNEEITEKIHKIEEYLILKKELQLKKL